VENGHLHRWACDWRSTLYCCGMVPVVGLQPASNFAYRVGINPGVPVMELAPER